MAGLPLRKRLLKLWGWLGLLAFVLLPAVVYVFSDIAPDDGGRLMRLAVFYAIVIGVAVLVYRHRRRADD